MKVSVRAEVGAEFVPFVRRYVRRAIEYMGGTPMLRIILVGDRRMRELHRRFMKVDSPTDVLTFPIDENEGEVYVNVAEARRQARLRGIEAKREVLLYAIHGMLHLLGYDDRTRRDFLMMHRMEDDILTRLGVGAVFGARERGAR